MGGGVHAAVDPQPHRLNPPVPGGGIRDTADLDDAVENDRAHADIDRSVDLDEALVVAVHPRRAGSTPAASATASSPPLQTSMRSPASIIQRATSMLRNALPA